MGRQNIIMGGGHRDLNYRRGVVGAELTLAQWAEAMGATTIYTLENSTPYLGIGAPPGTPTVGANVVFAPSGVVPGCSGKLIVTPRTTGAPSFYYVFQGGNVGSYGTDASRSLMTVVRVTGVSGAGAEWAMSSGGSAVASDPYNFTLQGYSGIAGTQQNFVNNGAWSNILQAGYVAGDICIYLTTYDDVTGDMVAWIKGTGKPAVNVTIVRGAPGPASTEGPGIGGDIRHFASSTTDEVYHFSCFPSALTSSDLAAAAAIVGAA